jgi:quercetin 2,3-dioxygenase
VTGLDQRMLLAPADGSLGPLLRIADDRLDPGAGYGRHDHRAVDVVAVVLAGSLRHRWGDGVALGAGDVAVLRAGAGLEHDEVAGDDGARVLQCYLRSADPAAAPSHEVHRAASGWVDLRRADARLWVARAAPGAVVEVPPGLLVVRGVDGARVARQDGGPVAGPGQVLVWQLDTGRPAWAAPE